MVRGGFICRSFVPADKTPLNKVDKPTEHNFDSIRRNLMRMVPLCLDSDPSLIPLSCRTPEMQASLDANEDRDPDDFSFWSERQAKRICGAIKQTFDVEYAPEVVVADANLSALANRILVSKEILSD
jgi:phosphatidylethanolamine N-methyltransferase